MPWCASVEIAFAAVASWPPPWPAVETKIDAYLPASAPCAQSWPVESQNDYAVGSVV